MYQMRIGSPIAASSHEIAMALGAAKTKQQIFALREDGWAIELGIERSDPGQGCIRHSLSEPGEQT